MAILAAGGLLAGNPALHAEDTNQPPATPPTGNPASPRPAGMRIGPTLEQLTKSLNLTTDQVTKVKPILDARDQKVRDLRGDTSLSSQDRRTKMLSIREETATQLKAILTPEQYDKWQKMLPMGIRGPRPNGDAPGGTNTPVAPPKNLSVQ